MKAIFLLCGLLILGQARGAEPAVAPVPTATPVTSDPAVNATATSPGGVIAPAPGRTAPPSLPDRRKTRGAIPALVRSENPLHMINPLAPAAYGDGTEFISFDPVTRSPQGVTLFSFSLPESSGLKKEKPKKAKSAPRRQQ